MSPELVGAVAIGVMLLLLFTRITHCDLFVFGGFCWLRHYRRLPVRL